MTDQADDPVADTNADDATETPVEAAKALATGELVADTADKSSATPPPKPQQISAAAAMLGEAVWLMSRSDAHKHLFMNEIDWLVLPPVQLRQFRIWRRDKQPIGYASWAYLSDEAAARFADGASGTKLRRIAPGEWKSGDQLWLVGVVSPFGAAEGMIKELREKVFAGQKTKTLQQAPDGSGIAVVE